MEKRVVKVMFAKGGSGSLHTKLNVPITWIRAMGISAENRRGWNSVRWEENNDSEEGMKLKEFNFNEIPVRGLSIFVEVDGVYWWNIKKKLHRLNLQTRK